MIHTTRAVMGSMRARRYGRIVTVAHRSRSLIRNYRDRRPKPVCENRATARNAVGQA